MTLHRRTFLKQLGLGAAGLGLASSWPERVVAQEAVFRQLPRSSPEEQGVSSAGIVGFLEAIAQSQHEFHGFTMVRHGHVIADGWWKPYRPESNHMLYSMSKSFTSSAVGFAVSEGKFTVNDPVTSFFPDELPTEVSAHLSSLRVKHLLMMSVGHEKDSTPIITKEQNWVKSFLSLPIAHEPGSVFLYNSGATYMLSAIVQKVTGQKVMDYLRPRLFEPLAIKGMTWETCPRGINTGGWGLSVQTASLAKFGQFYLQKGLWNGRRLLPAAWIDEATSFKIQQPPGHDQDLEKLKETSDWHQGYCYQFWRCRHHGFRGDGAFGQYTIVLPEKQAVVAINSETGNMQGVLNLVWDHLLPAMSDSPVPANALSQKLLRKTLAGLALPLAQGKADAPLVGKLFDQNFKLEPNAQGVQSASLRFKNGQAIFSASDAQGEHTIPCGSGKWVEGVSTMPGTPPKITVGDLRPCKVAASGAWQEDGSFRMLWRFYETPHSLHVTCHFDGNKIRIEFLTSMTKKTAEHPEPNYVWQGVAS